METKGRQSQVHWATWEEVRQWQQNPEGPQGVVIWSGGQSSPNKWRSSAEEGCKHNKWDRVTDIWRVSGGRHYAATVQIKMDNVSFGYSWFTFLGHRPCMHLTAWLQLIIETSTSPLPGFLQQGQQTFSKRTDSKYLNFCRLDGLCHHYTTPP